MKIILAVIRDSDEAQVVEEMVKLGIRVTRMAGTGGSKSGVVAALL